MKKIFYIILLIGGFLFSGFSQTRSVVNQPKLIRYYPNPAINDINFEFVKGYDKTYSLEIYNFIGKKLLSVKALVPKMNVQLEGFYRGVYIYQIHDRSGKIIESGKFQVVR